VYCGAFKAGNVIRSLDRVWSKPARATPTTLPVRRACQLSFAIVRGEPMGSLALRTGLPSAACHVMDLSRGEIRNETIDILRGLVFGFDRRM